MAFREKLAWVSVLVTAGVFLTYGLSLASPALAHALGGTARTRLVGAVFVEILLATIMTIVIAVTAPKEANAPRDEREQAIAARSAAFAYGLIASLLWMVMAAGVFLGADGMSLGLACLAVLVAGEIARFTCQIIAYRRGA